MRSEGLDVGLDRVQVTAVLEELGGGHEHARHHPVRSGQWGGTPIDEDFRTEGPDRDVYWYESHYASTA